MWIKGGSVMNNNIEIEESIQSGIAYLLSQTENGLCLEYHCRRHGPSTSWTTACVGSALSCVGVIDKKMVDAVLSLQHENGGWAYNHLTPPDTDSTLRVIEFLQKIGFQDKSVMRRAEEFVILHQGIDGGFSTYLPDSWSFEEYGDQKGWSSSHPDVTAVAIEVLSKNALSDKKAISKARQYLDGYIFENGPTSYWWNTQMYIIYTFDCIQKIPAVYDAISISLALLQEARHGIADNKKIGGLLSLQNANGSFRPSRQLKIPRPHEMLNTINPRTVSIEPDENSILSTSAAIVALHKQLTLLKNKEGKR